MAKLRYSAITSLDGFVNDDRGTFDWAAPDEEVHAFVNDRERSIGTYLYGRRMYDVMRYWGSPDPEADRSPVSADYRRIWQSADKLVYSRTLAEVQTERTSRRAAFGAEELRHLKQTSARDLSIGGPTLTAQALAAGLVDEVALFLQPVAVGGGTPALPRAARVDLVLREERTFASGVVFVCYDVRTEGRSNP